MGMRCLRCSPHPSTLRSNASVASQLTPCTYERNTPSVFRLSTETCTSLSPSWTHTLFRIYHLLFFRDKAMLANTMNSFPFGLRGKPVFKALWGFLPLGGEMDDTSQVCTLTQPVYLQRMLMTTWAQTQQKQTVESPVARTIQVCSANHSWAAGSCAALHSVIHEVCSFLCHTAPPRCFRAVLVPIRWQSG